jgi:hypothetical protein
MIIIESILFVLLIACVTKIIVFEIKNKGEI